jgi:acyl dehydratase
VRPEAEGTTYPDVSFFVDPQRVAAFRALFGQAGGGVPPTFVTAAEFAVLPTIVGDPAVGLDFTRVVHGTQEYTFSRPLREGETLTVQARIESIRVKGSSGFLTIVMDLVGEGGEPVCTARSQMIERSPEP